MTPTVDPHAWVADMHAHPLTHQFRSLANHHRLEAARFRELAAASDLNGLVAYAYPIAYNDGRADAYEVAATLAAGR